MRTVFAGLALALLGAVTLFISPSGVAFADTKLEKCAKDGSATTITSGPVITSSPVSDDT